IEENEGYSRFLVLRGIRTWSENKLYQDEAKKNVELLVNRVSAALEKQLGDPKRINRFIQNLDSPSVEERAYARLQLKRSKARAIPALVQALRDHGGTPLSLKIQDTLTRLDPETVPPLLEVLVAADAKDAQDTDLRVAILNVLRRRLETRAVPYLWHLSA